MEEIQVIRDLTNIKPEFRYKAPRTLNHNLEVLEAKVPIKAAKSMIVAEIIEDKTQDISYKMKFADGRIEDREMTIIPKPGEIRMSKASLIHIPKWVVIFKAKEFIYARKILAASNTKLMDELEYCPKHFSRWKVWEGKRPCYAICDACGGAYCEDHISKVKDVYLCEEHMKD
jgi:hypothetical protein